MGDGEWFVRRIREEEKLGQLFGNEIWSIAAGFLGATCHICAVTCRPLKNRCFLSIVSLFSFSFFCTSTTTANVCQH